MNTEQNTGKIKITQIKSVLGRQKSQIGTLVGLGLNKIRKVSVLEDTASVRGMINKVRHLVEVEQL